MLQKSNMALKQNSPYSAGITREQFLFYEMRTTAKLLTEGLSQEQVVARIVSDNLFQYPTEKSIRGIARACIHRLEAMEDETLIRAVAEEPSEVAKQICLYAMMREHRLVRDFMLTVIGEKYRLLDSSYSRSEINVFMLRL